ncbi:DUF2203 domain-containing protein [Cohnella sp.]|uniref:DUF2203 domain-containing protein n=1 Tax=Cohnella sp. TaxID=1883426 RepID=UPI0035659D8F
MEDKLFTLSEANALLPQLNEDLLNLQALAKQFEEKYVELHKNKTIHEQSSAHVVSVKDPFFEEEVKLDFMRAEADLLIENFKRKGVLLKTIEPGLIDFPAIVNGQEVLICWQQGEDQITHYHGWNDGFMGRKPLPENQ